MDDAVTRFAQEQASAIEKVLAASNREVISAVDQKMTEVMKAAQQTAIAKERANKVWQLITVAVPVVLTAVLGFWVWVTQSDIQAKVEDNHRLLSTRLALREEFYKRRLDTYRDTCKHLANLRESLDLIEQAQIDPNINVQAVENIKAVDKLRKSEFLYMSKELVAELGDLWGLAVDRMRASGDNGATIMEKITTQVSALETRMKADLQLDKVGQIP